ncbi:MAG: mechanosensitive ion channel domain-containing protein, partial [Candidatus Hydrogenedentota bacterium]
RIVFLVLMAALVVALHLAARPAKSPIAALVAARGAKPHAWALRLGHALATLVPAALFAMALAGYQYTALQLSWRLYMTLCLALVLALAHGMIMRWLLITRRRLAVEQARRKRDASAAKALSEDGPTPIAEEPSLDFAAISIQSSRAVRGAIVAAGILAAWFIWKDVLPALRVFERYEVWSIPAEDGSGVPTPITLANVALAMLLAAIAVVATRNIPGVLEILVLQRMKLASGERHAITTIVRYALIAAGAVASFSALGIGWSKVQWLVAALSLGLGFGLQEIFANFVSGIIILFEQPIRVGDTITVGDRTGTVSRIRIRATTIRDWDFKELIVPNRELVTSKLVNWTLTDTTIRLVVPVGIAYGSDVEKASRLMIQAAKDCGFALEDPAPQVSFMAFGESSLNFELRFFCATMEDHLSARHAVHVAIDKAFREAGIEIAFPQRDIRIRDTGSPLA